VRRTRHELEHEALAVMQRDRSRCERARGR
jgi:hypothetical protein